MASKLITHKVMLPEGEPPSEFLLVPYGLTETTEGNYRLDESSAKEVIATFKRRELKLFFDYNHLSLDPKTPDDGIAAGWYDIELRESGIWVKNIKWTEKAYAHIVAREFAYFSPVIKTNKNGHMIRLFNVALTNLPATDKLAPIIALSEVLASDLTEVLNETSEVVSKYRLNGLKLNKEDIKQLKELILQIESFGEKMEPMENKEEVKSLIDVVNVIDDEDEDDDEKDEDEKDEFKMKEHLAKLDETMDSVTSMGQHLSKRMMEHTDSPMSVLYGKAHGLCMKMAELISDKRKEMDPQGIYEKKAMYSEVVKDEASLILSEIEKITGNTGKELISKVLGYKVALDSVKELSEKLDSKEVEVTELKEKLASNEKLKLVEDSISKTKKLMPKQKEWAMSLSTTQLEAYLLVAPTISLSEKVIDKVESDEGSVITLTESDLSMIKTLGISEEKYKEQKRKIFGK